MIHLPSAAPDLDAVIAEITMDANGEDEALSGFEIAFDDAVRFPISGTVIGEDVQVSSVGVANGRWELMATCERAGRRYRIALLDLDLTEHAAAMRLIAACRR